jgi:hypothetical protein
VPQAAAPPRPRVICKMVRTFERWDCINAGQRESATEPRFTACTSILTSQASRRTPPKCGAFRFQPRGSPLRQTGCWSKADSDSRSHRERNGRGKPSQAIIAMSNLKLWVTGGGPALARERPLWQQRARRSQRREDRFSAAAPQRTRWIRSRLAARSRSQRQPYSSNR